MSNEQPSVPLRIKLCLVADTALSVGAGGSAGTFADKTIIRDGYGRPIIPGSQLKGKLRHAAEALARSLAFPNLPESFDDPRVEQDEHGQPQPNNVITALFGSTNYRSPLVFADLVGVVGDPAKIDIDTLRNQPEQHRSLIRPSVALNRRRRVAEDARLLFQETSLAGTRFYAERAITGRVPHERYVGLLWAALLLTTRWGGASSRGLGWMSIEQLVVTCNGQTTTILPRDRDDNDAASPSFAHELRALTAQQQQGKTDA
jgi:CRISPR/Cas system CSM-associated protein Csm3 (group 7 of RAMP superfamily)